jgi:hypothetical protein
MKTKLPNTIKPACSTLDEGENQTDKATANLPIRYVFGNVTKKYHVKDSDNVTLATCYESEDAALIVQAVNEREALLTLETACRNFPPSLKVPIAVQEILANLAAVRGNARLI